MQVVSRESALWQYLTPELQDLINDGENLLDHAQKHGQSSSSDFSYLIFPFGKAYEGYLKRLFLDLDIIKEDEYYGDDIRIGRILNPHYIHENENVFDSLCAHAGSKNGDENAMQLWRTWKRGRNQVFHYFPHNYKKPTYKESLEIIRDIISSMELGVASCNLK